MPFIEIDGKKIEVEAGSMIIEVADSMSVQIPRFCYHKKLSIAANCRMCLVEVERAPKPLPACATPITEGMKIWTRSPKALLAQKTVMEFLLINHPLDCPICDQGGECELQDLSMGYGQDDSRYSFGKRVVEDKDLGPLISTDMTRCIQCTRCVRFGTEVAGVREMGATGRGECLEIGTFIEKSVTSEVSGNIIDLCPVGALTSKPYRFTARGWELKQTPSIAPHDCVGSNIYVHSRRDQIMRVVPRENELINEVWISDRDRFSYEGLYSDDRLTQPKIKREEQWQTVSWAEALEFATKGILQIVNSEGPNELGAYISPNATIEEGYLLQKWIRSLGSHNIDHRLRQTDFRHQTMASLFPKLGIPIAEIEHQSIVLLVGSDVRKEQPIIGLKLRKMTSLGGKILAVNPIQFSYNFDLTAESVVPRGDLALGLAKIAKAVLKLNPNNVSAKVSKELDKLVSDENDLEIAKYLMHDEKKLIILGAYSIAHPKYSEIVSLAKLISQLTGATLGVLTDGTNAAGAWISGCVPHRLPGGQVIEENAGFDARQMWEKNLKSYVLFNLEPDLDCHNGLKALQALGKAKFVVSMTTFISESMYKIADVLLPLTPFTETPGTWVNTEGTWQTFKAVVPPHLDSKPGWKILRVLGNLCNAPNFDYESIEIVLAALKKELSLAPAFQEEKHILSLHFEHQSDHQAIVRIAPIPLYASDGLVRRAKSLQATEEAQQLVMRLNNHLVERLKLEGDSAKIISEGFQLTLPFVIDNAVPDQCVVVTGGLEDTVALGGPYSMVEIKGVH